MVGKVKWDLTVDVADNGSLCILKCVKCRKKFAHVFLESKDFDIWTYISAWKKDIVDNHSCVKV